MPPDWKMLPIHELKPAGYNPRRPLTPDSPAYQRLTRSLKEFGLVQPLVWNERTGNVVGGHQRLEVLRSMGVTEVPVVVVKLDDANERLLNVALNNSEVGSDWDMARLSELIAELQKLPDVDATLTGFDEATLRSLVLEPVVAVERLTTPEPVPFALVSIEVPETEWPVARQQIDELVAGKPWGLHVQFRSSTTKTRRMRASKNHTNTKGC